MKSRIDLNEMICLDVFLGRLGQDPDPELDSQLVPSQVSHPLLAWDIASQRRFQTPASKAIRKLRELAKLHKWTLDISLFLRKDFDALVVTDLDQVIAWVSDGFEEMTGYCPLEVVGQKPNLLQGPKTSLESKKRIREAIMKKRPMKATLLNYKKDGTAYRCRIEVIPIFIDSQTHTHFLAIEKSI
ncbi:PAS domain-containing protein [Algoriphagus terrigena]|uniref:PAS domain-containing protein n=1 Tax=Algoriphagus terrigena TaxID=344884 RepID=UPI0004276729|nr:PAS domain-containing protein [Algoriphagus terrigena]